jgi:hypothetical protein
MRSNVPVIAIAASLAAYMPWSKVDSVAAADLVAITPVKGCAELEKLDLSRGDAGQFGSTLPRRLWKPRRPPASSRVTSRHRLTLKPGCHCRAGPSATFSSAAEVTAAA